MSDPHHIQDRLETMLSAFPGLLLPCVLMTHGQLKNIPVVLVVTELTQRPPRMPISEPLSVSRSSVSVNSKSQMQCWTTFSAAIIRFPSNNL
jgi:hypothetical protein